MAFQVGNVTLVKLTNPGQGTFILPSAAEGGRVHPSFWLANNDTTYYRVEATDGSAWEEGTGTFTTSGNGQLSRDTVYSTSAGKASSTKINFTGEVWVFIEIPRAKRILLDPSGALVDGAGNAVATAGSLIGVQIFTASGPYTPTAGTASVVVELIAGGGGGGGATSSASQVGAGGGGGSGEYAFERITSGLGATETVTIGAGGAGGAAGNNNGAAGGTTSFGSHLSGGGGAAGTGSASTNLTIPTAAGGTGGSGGTGSSHQVVGNPGEAGSAWPSNTTGKGGAGGAGRFGGAGNGPIGGNNNGGAADDSSGAGGGGGACGNGNTAAGGDGADGIVIVREYS